MLLVVITLFFTNVSLFAQIEKPTEPTIIVGDTLYVFPTFNGEDFDALNKWIDYGFSLNDAANDTSVKIFKLARNETYKISHEITTTRHLHIVAKKPDANNAPPYVIGATDLNNEFPKLMITNFGPLTLKHIYFCGADIEAPVIGQGAQVESCFELKADSVALVVDGCYFEWFGKNGGRNKGLYNDVTYINNLAMNCMGFKARKGVGGMFVGGKQTQKRIIRNNTSINNGAWSLNVGGRKDIHLGPGIIEHNTIINELRFPFYGTMWTDAIVRNNILYNAYCWGAEEKYKPGQDPDALSYSLINIDTLTAYIGLDTLFAEHKGITVAETESHRRLEVLNNYYGWTEEILNYWETVSDSVEPAQWMNSRTQAMFDDDESYPYLIEEGTYTKDEYGAPQFAGEWKSEEQMDLFITYLQESLREGGTEVLSYPYVPVEGYPQPNPVLTWPPVFDLRVENSALVGTDGKPIGDLNWYPEYAERWDMTDWGIESSVTEANSSLPVSFSLKQNYPNPFNPSTNIDFTLSSKSIVKLSVYNMLGQMIKILVNEKTLQGAHTVKWDGTNELGEKVVSGVYFYKLDIGDYSKTMKMLLIK